MLGCIVSNCGTQTILRVQIDTNISPVYRFYIYCKRPKINTFQKGRCTHAYTTIVFGIGIAALLIFGIVKFNDNPFLEALSLFSAPKKSLQFLLLIFFK